eukprot:6502905-Alexandrium_andersonii.AAC.1
MVVVLAVAQRCPALPSSQSEVRDLVELGRPGRRSLPYARPRWQALPAQVAACEARWTGAHARWAVRDLRRIGRRLGPLPDGVQLAAALESRCCVLQVHGHQKTGADVLHELRPE